MVTIEKFKTIWPYAGIPIIGATLFLLQSRQTDAFAILWWELIMAFGYVAAVSDIKSKRIPNSLVLAMFGAWVITMAPKLIMDIDTAIALLKDSAWGFVIGGGLFLLMYIISRKGVGGGDVKFMAAAGLYLGLAGILPAMLIGTVLAALTGLFLIIFKKISRKDSIPLVPFLYLGILVVCFAAQC
ncbi:MAG: prepilin peptidase [Clostridiales bacterium]|nr:prepilin peptidase [Clostridiales bacterium]